LENSDIITLASGGLIDFGLSFSDDNCEVFAFPSILLEAQKWVIDNASLDSDPIQRQIFYYDAYTSSPKWSSNENAIYLPKLGEGVGAEVYDTHDPFSRSNRTVVFHEYGHSIHDEINNSKSLPGKGGNTGFNKETTEGDAITEGWATFFQTAVLAKPSEIPPDDLYVGDIELGVNLDNYDGTYKNANKVQGCVAAIWWDLYDSTNKDENVQKPVTNIFKIMAKNPQRMWSENKNGDHDFYHYWNSIYGQSQEIDQIFKMNGIPVIDQTVVKTTCPVDISLIDPDGLVINKNHSDIPYATYDESDLDEDGDLDDRIIIPQKKDGYYYITITAEPGAFLNDTFSLEVSINGNTIELAKLVTISNIPKKGYFILSKGTTLNGGIVSTPVPSISFLGGAFAILFIGVMMGWSIYRRSTYKTRSH
jgi:hypothetical protein